MSLGDWLDLVGLLVLALTAVLGLRQIRLYRDESRATAVREHRRHSLEIDARLASFASQRRKVEEAFPVSEWAGPIPLEKLRAVFEVDDEVEPSLRTMIEQLELLALPVCAEAADADMAFELIGSTMVSYAQTFREYYRHLRKTENRPDFYIYTTTLVDTKWAQRDLDERALILGGKPPFFLRKSSRSYLSRAESGRLGSQRPRALSGDSRAHHSGIRKEKS